MNGSDNRTVGQRVLSAKRIGGSDKWWLTCVCGHQFEWGLDVWDNRDEAAGKPLMVRCHECEQAVRTNTRHTPRPWHANCPAKKKYCTDITIRDIKGVVIAVVAKDSANASANANLIASAPDLLELCREAYHELQYMHAAHYWKTCEGGCPTLALMDKLRAALPGIAQEAVQ